MICDATVRGFGRYDRYDRVGLNRNGLGLTRAIGRDLVMMCCEIDKEARTRANFLFLSSLGPWLLCVNCK